MARGRSSVLALASRFDDFRLRSLDPTFGSMISIRRRRVLVLTLTAVVMISDVAVGRQTYSRDSPGDTLLRSDAAMRRAIPFRHAHENSEAGLADYFGSDVEGGKFRTRQAFLLSGVAVSMLAYGYFALQFNNGRTDSEAARLAYEADVRENAQFYVDEGIALDQIPTYFAWEDSYTDAANARERISVAGLSALLLGLAAILDSATHGNKQPSKAWVRTVTPLFSVSPSSGDVTLGARIGL